MKGSGKSVEKKRQRQERHAVASTHAQTTSATASTAGTKPQTTPASASFSTPISTSIEVAKTPAAAVLPSLGASHSHSSAVLVPQPHPFVIAASATAQGADSGPPAASLEAIEIMMLKQRLAEYERMAASQAHGLASEAKGTTPVLVTPLERTLAHQTGQLAAELATFKQKEAEAEARKQKRRRRTPAALIDLNPQLAPYIEG